MQHTVQQSLSDEKANALLRLLELPASQAALLEAEKLRDARRASILEKANAERADLLEKARTVGIAVQRQAKFVDELRQKLFLAELEHRRLENESSVAGDGAERVVNRALWELRVLGGDAIEEAIGLVLHAQAAARGLLQCSDEKTKAGPWYRPHMETAIVCTTPQAAARWQRMKELHAELEAMKLAPSSPREIEIRCAQIVAEVNQGDVPAPEDKSLERKYPRFKWPRGILKDAWRLVSG